MADSSASFLAQDLYGVPSYSSVYAYNSETSLSSAFTIELFIGRNWANPSSGTPMFHFSGNYRDMEIGVTQFGDLYFSSVSKGGSISANANLSSFGLTDSRVSGLSYVHIAVTRSGGTLRLFIHGHLALTMSDSADYTCTSGMSTVGYPAYGWFMARISPSTARYTADFTPPTEAFPWISDLSVNGAVVFTYSLAAAIYKGKNLSISGNAQYTWSPSSRLWSDPVYGHSVYTYTIAAGLSISAHPPYYEPANGGVTTTAHLTLNAKGGGQVSISYSNRALTASGNVYPVPVYRPLRGPALSLRISNSAWWYLRGPQLSTQVNGTVLPLPGFIAAGPLYTVNSHSGAYAGISAPVSLLTFNGTVIVIGRAYLRTPTISTTGTVSSGQLGRASIALAPFTTLSTGGGQARARTPRLTTTGHGYHRILGTAVIQAPRWGIRAHGYSAVLGRAALVGPTPRSTWAVARLGGFTSTLTAFAERSTVHTVAYVMNLDSGAVTKYQNYGFDNIVNFGSKYYGVKADGVYLLEGGTDAGNVIVATATLPPMDYGTSFEKRITDIYIDTDNSTYTTPNADGVDVGPYLSIFAGRKTHVGKGARARYWGVKVENVDGGEMNIKSIEIATMATRRVK